MNLRRNILTLGLVFCSLSAVAAELDTNELVQGYRAVSTELAQDHYLNTQLSAKALAHLGEEWLKTAKDTDANVPHVKKLVEGALAMSQTKEEKTLREKFAVLSEGACRILRADVEAQKQWQLYRCPMVKTFPFWAQPKGEKMANPFMGTEMLQCGTKKPWTALD